jgi:hypothetical protein
VLTTDNPESGHGNDPHADHGTRRKRPDIIMKGIDGKIHVVPALLVENFIADAGELDPILMRTIATGCSR